MNDAKNGISIEQLAQLIDVPLETLKLQLKEAGIPLTGPITDSQKKTLLLSLKRSKQSGKTEGEETSGEPKKITLKRKSVSEIKVQRSSGKKGTVSVVRKKRHVYVKREPDAQTEAQTDLNAQSEAATKTAETEARLSEVFVPEETLIQEKAKAEKEHKEAEKALAEPEQTLAATESVPVVEKPLVTEEKPGVKGKGKHREFDEEEKAKPKTKGKAQESSKDWRKDLLPRTDLASLTRETEDEEEEESGSVVTRKTKARPKPKVYAETPIPKKLLQKKHLFEKPQGPITREIALAETITVGELAQKMSVKASEVIKYLMKMGTMATINQALDQATATLVVEGLGHRVKLVKETSLEDRLELETEGELQSRGPVVTVMGHVDHGKTSLLDYIRRTRVVAGEAGGITQHIGAYHVKTDRGNITFLDTPGHAAFTAMRARGVQCTDIVVLVVAADDGAMPQTIEAIQHAKAAEAPIVVAVNKMDKPDADINRVYNDLSQHGLLPESWGGDVMFLPVSAKEGTGIDALLEAIALQAEMLELKAPVQGSAKGVVLESRLDKGRGPVASVLVQKGTLRKGDVILAGFELGRVRAMMDEVGQQVQEAGPSIPVEILGFSGIPHVGEAFVVVPDERTAREIAELRQTKDRNVKMTKQTASLENLFDKLQADTNQVLNIILKADVQGSAEAITDALTALSTEKVKVNIVSQGVGGINESDITLAMASSALVIGFNVRADATARRLASQEGIELDYFSIIYDLVDGVKRAIHGMLGPEYKEKILGIAEVRDVFRSAKLGAIAGCMVVEGVVKRGCPIRVLRNNIVIYQGELESLRRFKEDVSEVRAGTECGIGVKNYNDVKPGDNIEVFETIQVART